MIKYKNLTIIGTSHVAIQSIKEVESTILRNKPEIIALELDQIRLAALTTKGKKKLGFSSIKKFGIKGLIINTIGAYIEKKIGKIVKVTPGSEMLKAIELSKKTKSKIYLIDQDIRITLKKLSDSITRKEKINFLLDLLRSAFKKTEIKIDLRKVPSKKIIRKLTSQLKKRYPSIYKILIKDRNKIMAKNLNNLINKYPDKKILAIVGAGHEEDIVNLIK